MFFFQAEDGIRDTSVTGVQTCALPISCGLMSGPGTRRTLVLSSETKRRSRRSDFFRAGTTAPRRVPDPRDSANFRLRQIGRASCRERVEIALVGGGWRGQAEEGGGGWR